MNHFIPVIITMLIAGIAFSSAYAHTTVTVGQYDLEVGWGIEPPVVGIRNDFVFEISEPGETEGVKTGVKNAFKNLEATAKFGGITKTLEINADVRAGHYHSPVIPTKTGSIMMNLKGEINGVEIDVDIPVEDVETTSVLDFPPKSSSGDTNIDGILAAIKQLQKDVDAIKSGTPSGPAQPVGPAYDFAIFGLSLGAAGVVLAVIAMIKRK